MDNFYSDYLFNSDGFGDPRWWLVLSFRIGMDPDNTILKSISFVTVEHR